MKEENAVVFRDIKMRIDKVVKNKVVNKVIDPWVISQLIIFCIREWF